MSRNILQANVYDKSSALDVIFGFLQIAQRRGAFSFGESAKIYECMNQFSDFFQHEIPPKEEVEDPPKEDDQDDAQEEKFDTDDEKDAVDIEVN
tara:strand:- start:1330 stop:1611 length:282 start_codon:yes stop_codon:yes gene_type:complete